MPNLQGQPAIDYLMQRGLYDSIKAKVEADGLTFHQGQALEPAQPTPKIFHLTRTGGIMKNRRTGNQVAILVLIVVTWASAPELHRCSLRPVPSGVPSLTGAH